MCWLILISLFSVQIFAEDFEPIGTTFSEGMSSSQDKPYFAPPESDDKSLGAFAPPEAQTANASSGMFSVIDSSMAASPRDGSIGERFLAPSNASSLEYKESEDEQFVPEAPVPEWSYEQISGVTEQSVEEMLSSRGLPKVRSNETNLDILGLPKPDIVGINDPIKKEEKAPNEENERVKVRFLDLFMKKQ